MLAILPTREGKCLLLCELPFVPNGCQNCRQLDEFTAAKDVPQLTDRQVGMLRGTVMQLAQEEEREQAIGRALDLFFDPSRFAREICERPRSKAEARAQLEENGQAVAFRYCPAKGNHAGQMLLAFTPVSLRRLLRRVGCGEELYDAVLDAAAKSGLLAERSCTIRVGQDTITAVTFCAE